MILNRKTGDESLGFSTPLSGCQGIGWPALPHRRDAVLLALHYQLEQSQWWPEETLLAMQLRQAERLIAHAARTVPYYGKKLNVLRGLKGGQLTVENWRKIPLLRRTDIQDAGDTLESRNLPKAHGKPNDVSSSGSTGRPITVKTTPITGMFFQALNLRLHKWHGRDLTAKTVAIRVLRGAHIKAAKEGKPIPWARAFKSGPMMFLDLRTPIEEQFEWLCQQKAEYVLTYPSNLMGLLKVGEERGEVPPNLHHVATMGEMLDPETRAACERIWKVPVIDAYSSQEVGMIAMQCPDHNHYHVQAESLLVEILDDDGKPCKPGQSGRVVLTDLHNFATPLIRYEVGDYAEPGEKCSCGRGLPVIKRILGRTRNLVTLPTGERFSQSFSLFKLGGLKAIRQVQLIQKTVNDIEAKLVVTQPLTENEETELRRIITDGLGYPFDISIVYVDHIPRSKGGKFEEFMSEVES